MMMKFAALAVVICVIAPIFATSDPLGADDVDLRIGEVTDPAPPIELHSKDEAKEMRVDMQQKKEVLMALKTQLKDTGSELSKAQKVTARERYNLLKKEVKAERNNLSKYAVERTMTHTVNVSVSSGGKKHKGDKEGKKKSRKDGKKGKKHDKMTENVESERVVEVEEPTHNLTKAELKERRRLERRKMKKEGKTEMKEGRAERKERRLARTGTKPDMLKGEVVESLEMMADAPVSPVLPIRQEKLNRGNRNSEEKKNKERKHRKSCDTQTDCEDNEVCSANKKGKRVCFPNGRMDKKENRKCLSTAQCARHLACFVPQDAKITKDGRRHGVCKNRSNMTDEEKRTGNFLAQ